MGEWIFQQMKLQKAANFGSKQEASDDEDMGDVSDNLPEIKRTIDTEILTKDNLLKETELKIRKNPWTMN